MTKENYYYKIILSYKGTLYSGWQFQTENPNTVQAEVEKVLADMKTAGFNVTHLYGLTETYGPAVVNEWQSYWNEKDAQEQAALKARQGVRYLPLESLTVLNPDTMEPVPADGKTIGEVMFKGNFINQFLVGVFKF